MLPYVAEYSLSTELCFLALPNLAFYAVCYVLGLVLNSSKACCVVLWTSDVEW